MSAAEVGKFLINRKGLSRQMVGEFLGNNSEFSKQVLQLVIYFFKINI